MEKNDSFVLTESTLLEVVHTSIDIIELQLHPMIRVLVLTFSE